MAGKRYKFNPESLSYESVGLTQHEKVLSILGYLSTGVAIALFFVLLFSNFYESPKIKRLKRENQQLLAQYKLMSKDMDKIGKVLTDLQQRDDNIYRVVFEADPIPSSVREAGFGGVNKYSRLENMDNAELVIETAKKLDILSKKAYIQSKSYDEVIKMVLNKEKMLSSIPSIQPVSNKDLKRLSSGFGYRMHPIYKVRKMHYGQDFSAPVGTPVYATGDGKVYQVKGNKRSKIGFGLVVKINHGYGYETVYAHLSGFNVKRGQKVKRGDIIGYVGCTGGSTAPHLHYEVHKNGKAVDPAYYFFQDLTPQEYEEMIAISSNIGQSMD